MEIIGVYIFAIPTWWSINKRKKVLYTWYLKHYWFMTVDLKAERNFNWKHKHQAWRLIAFVCLYEFTDTTIGCKAEHGYLS